MPSSKKIVDSDFEEGIKLHRRLSFYNHSDYLLKNKVKLLYVLTHIYFVLDLIMMGILFVAHQSNPIYTPFIITLAISLLLTALCIWLLIRGHYIVASNVMLINIFACVWTSLFIDKAVTIEQIDNIVYVFALMFFLPLIIQNKRSAFLISAINIALVVVLYAYNSDKIVALGGNGYNTALDCIIALTISSFLIMFTFNAYKNTIRKQQRYIEEIKDVSRKLEISEKKHHEFIEDFPETFFRTNANGELTYLNKTGFRALKATQNQLDKGINVFDLLSSDYRRARLYYSTINNNEAKNNEFILTFGNNKINVQLLLYPTLENNKIIRTEGIAIDISSRKQAESELKLSEKLLRSIIDDSPNIIILCDINGQILLANRTFAEYSGIEIKKVKGKQLSSSNDFSFLNSKELLQQIFTKGEVNGIETKHLNKQGEFIYFHYTCKLMYFKRQQIVYISGFNITTHKRVEEEIRKREEMLSKLLQATPNMVMLTDKDMIVSWCNDELLQVAGKTNAQITGKSVYDTLLNKTSLERGFIVNEISNKGFMRNCEAELIDNNGRLFDVLISSVPVLYNNKRMYLSVIVDTSEKAKIEKELAEYRKNLENIVQERTEELSTINEELTSTNEELYSTNQEFEKQNSELKKAMHELEKAQQQLIESEKMTSLGLLASGIAHEINNPLNYIKGGVLGIEDFLVDNLSEQFNEVKPLIDAVNEGVDRAARIVNGVSRYSHHSERNDEICDLHVILDSSIVLLHNQLKGNMVIQKQYTKSTLLICGNEGKLHQLFVNIIQNAIHAIGSKGLIIIKTRKQNNHSIIEISDNGTGISHEVMKHIFDPFFTTKEPGKGSGLGLAISYNIVMEHNGSINYSSTLGIGTKATIKFPSFTK